MSVLPTATKSNASLQKIASQKENETEKKNEDVASKKSNDVNSEKNNVVQERFLAVKKLVQGAVQAHKTFMIYGRARIVRESMLKRGWCEKFYKKNVDPHFNVDSSPEQLLPGIDLLDQQNEKILISRMLSNHTVDFLWNTGMEYPGWPTQENKTTIFNRYCRAGFTSKIGLCTNVRQMQWYYEAGVSHTLFPRCYNICQTDQLHAFIEDFRITACLSLLKWLVAKFEAEGEDSTRSQTGTIPMKALDFAIKRCSDYIDSQSHEDIDQEAERVWSYQWDRFIEWYYKIVQGEAIFARNNIPFHKYILAANHILQKMKKIWPQLEMDGTLNIWIVKPGNKSRGRGIVPMNKLQDILAKVNPTNKTDARYVVQKYIERPFLIYNTKFDIRQWFLITRTLPLTIWMYKESYLRFCTQKFTLSDFHESIHLCNYSVQCKYTNCTDRDPKLPVDNMWDATTFKQFLKNQGHDNVWDEIVYPGMKQGLIGSLLASQEAMDRRKNSFELYGADFMLMEDFSVWLIEINSHPDMSNSTSVTTKLCRQVMEDTIKVVIDSRENKDADTGLFELVYKQKMPTCQPYVGAALSLQGTRLPICEKRSTLNAQDKSGQNSKSPTQANQAKKNPMKGHIGPIFVDLIEELEMQLDLDMNVLFDKEPAEIKSSLPVEVFPEATKPVLADAETETKDAQAVSSENSEAAKNRTKQNSSLNGQGPANRTQRKRFPKKENAVAKMGNPKIPKDFGEEVNLESQSARFEAVLKQTREAILKNAIEKKVTSTLMTKYKQNLSLPSLSQSSAASKIVAERKRIKGLHRNRIIFKKNKVLLDVTDLYAVGLGVNK